MLFKDKREFFFETTKAEKVADVSITWSDHQPACANCRAVDFARPATLSLACALGVLLAKEALEKLNRPARQAKDAVVREWADKVGFKTYRGDRKMVKLSTKYK